MFAFGTILPGVELSVSIRLSKKIGINHSSSNSSVVGTNGVKVLTFADPTPMCFIAMFSKYKVTGATFLGVLKVLSSSDFYKQNLIVPYIVGNGTIAVLVQNKQLANYFIMFESTF